MSKKNRQEKSSHNGWFHEQNQIEIAFISIFISVQALWNIAIKSN